MLNPQDLKTTVDERRDAVTEVIGGSQKVIDTSKQSRDTSSQQLAQKLRCNTSDLKIGFDRVSIP